MIRTKILTHVETLQSSAIRVEGGVVEVSELLRDGVDVCHGEQRDKGGMWRRKRVSSSLKENGQGAA